MIYLDHNATTPLHPRVLEAMMPSWLEDWGNPSSPHQVGCRARLAVEEAREKVAQCLGARATEIIFCSSGTEADNLALRGVVGALRDRGTHVVTSTIEHHAVLNTCQALEQEGTEVTYLPVTHCGQVDVAFLERALRNDTILVSIMHANNETGVVQPLEAIARLTREQGIILHTDAVQSAGKLPLAQDGLGADLITISGHKFYGPKGIAALYVREGTPLRAMVTGGAHEHGLRAGTENVPAIVGLAEAFALAQAHVEQEGSRLQALRDTLEARIMREVPGVSVNGQGAPRVPNTSNMTFSGVDGESIVLGLDVRGICASTGSACSSEESEPSHVLRAMGLTAHEAQGSIRLSLGLETGEEDLDTITQALAETVQHLRRISSL